MELEGREGTETIDTSGNAGNRWGTHLKLMMAVETKYIIQSTKDKRLPKIIQKDREVKKREDKRRTFYQKSCCWILTEITIT